MLVKHLGEEPEIDNTAYIAPNATICGKVRIGKNTRIMFGVTVIAEGGYIEIGDNCVVLENAVLRSTINHSLQIRNNVLIGPNAHIVGCTIEDNVFVATGVSVFHGAKLCEGSEVRINGVVHIKTELPKHDEIWAMQEPLNFPKYVYGVDRNPNTKTIMPEILEMMVKALKSHEKDEIIK
jgi:carbonic anhydrase/acetyltransferase-like protein (isoleucine patch superfamily)